MKNSNGLNRTCRSATRSLAWSLLLAAAPDALGIEAVPDESISNVEAGLQVAQFQLPAQPSGEPAVPGDPGDPVFSRYPERPLISRLQYQFSYGSESDVSYRRNPDLDRRLKDTSLILSPQLNGAIIYRPTDRVEMMLEAVLQRDIAVKEQDIVTLPSGQTQLAPRHYNSLPIDQAWVTFKDLGPADLTLGRRNYEDDRHWLYDTSLDTALVKLKGGAFQAELSYSRKDRLDLDLLAPVQKTRNDIYMAYLSYRGIEDLRLAGYTIYREDQAGRKDNLCSSDCGPSATRPTDSTTGPNWRFCAARMRPRKTSRATPSTSAAPIDSRICRTPPTSPWATPSAAATETRTTAGITSSGRPACNRTKQGWEAFPS